ncbi:MAG TPA: methyltransferase, partial [Abditibacteriaceae bacterium]
MYELPAQQITVFRLALFFCCVGYCAVAYYVLKPCGRQIPAAIMAAWTQFSVGVLLDIFSVRLGFWTYRPMEWSLGNVPLDLHLDWTFIWGFAFVWLASRLRLFGREPIAVATYLVAWTLITVAFDAAFGRHLPFLQTSAPLWWMGDAVLVFVLLAVTLWVYGGILHPPTMPAWHRWNCCVRSVLYVSSLMYAFYVYLPQVILTLTGDSAVRPLFPLTDLQVLALVALPAFALGSWAMWAFADEGGGTPIPLDPPVRLVEGGPYAYVRNPMQISGMWLAVVLVMVYPTKFILFYLFDMAITAIVLMSLFEQAQLRNRFGRTYEQYERELSNWIPRLPVRSKQAKRNPR